MTSGRGREPTLRSAAGGRVGWCSGAACGERTSRRHSGMGVAAVERHATSMDRWYVGPPRTGSARPGASRLRRDARSLGSALPGAVPPATGAAAAAARDRWNELDSPLEPDRDRCQRPRSHARRRGRDARIRRAAGASARQPRDGHRAHRRLRRRQRDCRRLRWLYPRVARPADDVDEGGRRPGGARHAGGAVPVAGADLRRPPRRGHRVHSGWSRAHRRRRPRPADGGRDPVAAGRRRLGARRAAPRHRLHHQRRSRPLASGSDQSGPARARRALERGRALRDAVGRRSSGRRRHRRWAAPPTRPRTTR